jgi:hypothetical protein
MYKGWLVYPYTGHVNPEDHEDSDYVEKPELHFEEPPRWTSGEIKEIVFDFVKEITPL